MTMMSAVQIAATDPFVALLGTVINGLSAEDAQAILRFHVDKEMADFCWEARQREAWLGEYLSVEEDAEPLDRVAILSILDGRFHVGIALIDGDGRIHDLRRHRSFASAWTPMRRSNGYCIEQVFASGAASARASLPVLILVLREGRQQGDFRGLAWGGAEEVE